MRPAEATRGVDPVSEQKLVARGGAARVQMAPTSAEKCFSGDRRRGRRPSTLSTFLWDLESCADRGDVGSLREGFQ